MTPPFLWAHRGASAVAPENTMAAFRAAVAAGADGLELDIHLSRDGCPVVIHDESLERTTDGRGRVEHARLTVLQSLDAGVWFAPEFTGEPLPTLDEVLTEFAGHVRLNLEVKQADAGEAVLERLGEYPQADVLLSSFNWPLLTRLRRIAPELPLAVLTETTDWHRALRVAQEVGAVAFHPRVDLLHRPLLARCRVLGLPVATWTVDDPRNVRRLVRAGVAGVFTNDPAALSAYHKAR